jgi:hypothetical protein
MLKAVERRPQGVVGAYLAYGTDLCPRVIALIRLMQVSGVNMGINPGGLEVPMSK